ncbi:insulin-like growth factor 2 mRNA-binding protein 1 [Aplysia californica]|uniref:Insulin-like growth factor 2 mRNA-binding protein 1 n=1 Tax=Aplysia californica TaxID=6500 RepID=A0ABM0JM69_APLCA|nr:insulin-like growth factor 2 mRNA-binding protein 1 [Aplysia californica]
MMEKVFLGNLPGDVNESTLRRLLEQQGIIFNSISMKRNFAFVTVKDKYTVDDMVKKLNGYTLEGCQLQAEPSNGKKRPRTNKIQIRNVPSHCSKEQIEELVNVTSRNHKKFEQVGSEGAIYVTFSTPEEAEECVEQLNDYRFEDGTQLKVEFFRNQKRSNRSNSSSNPGVSRQELPLRIIISSDYVGAIIGKQGLTIRKITSESRARVDIHRRESHIPDTMVTIKGSPESCSKACQEIMRVVQEEAESLKRGNVPLKMLCPNSICGRIIGKQGNVIKVFMEDTSTNIVVSSFDPYPGGLMDTGNNYMDRVITISGSTENCSKAEGKISEKMRQCFEQDVGSFQFGPQQHLMFSGMPGLPLMPSMSPFQSMRPPMPYMGSAYYPATLGGPSQAVQQPEVVQLYIPEKSVGAVIGSKGQNIKNIMRLSGARIKILGANDKNGSGENNPFSNSGDERKTVISGSPEAQWKAQFYIFEKVKNELRLAAHDEVHIRTEIVVPKQSIGRIIGKGGQNVKEMQRVSGAIVQLPGEDPDVDEVPVTIIGNFYAAQSAQRRVRSLMAVFLRAQPAPRRARPGAPQQLM